MFGVQMKPGENPLPHIVNMFQSEWITAYDYAKAEPTTYRGESLEPSIRENKHFMITMFYIQELFYALRDWNFSDIDPVIATELRNWEQRGGMCIYLSVLAYCLLMQHKVVDDRSVRYIQGYYRHDERPDVPISLGKEHIGLHAWLTIKNAVVDLSIRQEEVVFDFGDNPYILGPVPDGLDLIGFPETQKTPKKYGIRFAKECGMKYGEWLTMHEKQEIISFKSIARISE